MYAPGVVHAVATKGSEESREFVFRSTGDVESPDFLQVACCCKNCLIFHYLKLAFLFFHLFLYFSIAFYSTFFLRINFLLFVSYASM